MLTIAKAAAVIANPKRFCVICFYPFAGMGFWHASGAVKFRLHRIKMLHAALHLYQPI
jgi:hypothetical protein